MVFIMFGNRHFKQSRAWTREGQCFLPTLAVRAEEAVSGVSEQDT